MMLESAQMVIAKVQLILQTLKPVLLDTQIILMAIQNMDSTH